MPPVFFVLAVFASLRGSLALDVVHAEGNPHGGSTTASSCCPAQALPPETLLSEAALLGRQADTFVRMHTRRHLGHDVNVFSFKQPSRLSDRELPFDLALVSTIDATGIVEVPTPTPQASDSWFPDYAWSHYVVCTTAGDGAKHLGWRFDRKPGALGLGPASFVALIVRSESSEAEPAGSVASHEPLAVAAAVGSDDTEEDVAALVVPQPLPVGLDAPGWLLKMVVAVTARSASVAKP